jgi:hypothetical protein
MLGKRGWIGLAVLLGMLAAACGGGQGAGEGPTPGSAVQLVVRNNNFSDVTVYAVPQGGDPQRVGMVSGTQTATFTLRAGLLGAGQLRLVADPLGGGGRGGSGPITVSPGQTITFTVEPLLGSSFAVVQ